MRVVLPWLGVLALACSGLSPTPNLIAREALSIELMGGTITEDEDFGDSADINVERGLSVQSLSWEPIDPEAQMRDFAEALATAMGMIAGAEGVQAVTGPIQNTRLGALPALEFETTLGPMTLLTTVWRCEAAGVEARLTTSSFSARGPHDAALATLRCGDKRVEPKVRPQIWSFASELNDWAIERDPGGDETRKSLDGAVVTAVNSGTLLADDENGAICRSSIRLSFEGMKAWLRLADTPRIEAAEGGCRASFRGFNSNTQSDIDGAVRIVACPGGALTAVCARPVEAGSDPMEACVRWVGCAAN